MYFTIQGRVYFHGINQDSFADSGAAVVDVGFLRGNFVVVVHGHFVHAGHVGSVEGHGGLGTSRIQHVLTGAGSARGGLTELLGTIDDTAVGSTGSVGAAVHRDRARDRSVAQGDDAGSGSQHFMSGHLVGLVLDELLGVRHNEQVSFELTGSDVHLNILRSAGGANPNPSYKDSPSFPMGSDYLFT